MKYKHLHTWDTMLGSYGYWKELMQELAEQDNAPLDCIFRRSNGEWECASSLTPTHRFWDKHKAIHGVTEGESK